MREQSDTIAFCHADPLQMGGEAVDPAMQISIRQGSTRMKVDDGLSRGSMSVVVCNPVVCSDLCRHADRLGTQPQHIRGVALQALIVDLTVSCSSDGVDFNDVLRSLVRSESCLHVRDQCCSVDHRTIA